MLAPETVFECVRQMLQLCFSRNTIISILKWSGHEDAEQIVSNIEDETVRIAVQKIA